MPFFEHDLQVVILYGACALYTGVVFRARGGGGVSTSPFQPLSKLLGATLLRNDIGGPWQLFF